MTDKTHVTFLAMDPGELAVYPPYGCRGFQLVRIKSDDGAFIRSRGGGPGPEVTAWLQPKARD